MLNWSFERSLRRQMTVYQECSERSNDCLRRLVSSLFEGGKDTHQQRFQSHGTRVFGLILVNKSWENFM
jgi:hypothetical protein